MGGINVECFYLTASVEAKPSSIDRAELEGPEPPGKARLPARRAYWSSTGDFVETPVYSFSELRPGNGIVGPALIEATDVIEPGWKFTLDTLHNGILERMQEAS